MAKRRRKPGAGTPAGAPPAGDRRTRRLLALAIFSAALVSRLLFWRSTPDRDWAWTAYFQGDAPLWLEYARAIELGQPFELGLPIHPPGAAWLVALFWNGLPTGIPFLRFSWVALGALVPLLVFLAASRSFPLRVAAFAGAWTAISTGLLVLSTSVNNETPYLVLAVGSMWFVEDLRERPTNGRIALWSMANAAACLFRVEHLLFFLLALAFFAVLWLRGSGGRGLRRVAASLFFFALPLVPWHLSAWSAIRRFNEEPRRLTAVEERAVSTVEEAARAIPWKPGALEKRDELPGFLRRTATAFVAATVIHRGGREVRREDFRILEEAFGYFPRPLSARPFVSSYGPLNFYLANNRGADGGFVRSPLAEPPPLAGGGYPAFLVQGLPPPDLSFVYPPHLRLFNEGYALGWEWIRENPGDFARLVYRKLSIFWSGAAMGFTGWNVPLGLSGLRRGVDMVAPEGSLATGWRILLALACLAGLAAGGANAALAPFLLFLASKVAVTLLFFGYVRQGALVIPVVALLAGLACDRWIFGRVPRLSERTTRRAATAFLLLAVGVEMARLLVRPELRIDGLAIGSGGFPPGGDHRTRRIVVD